VADLETEIVLLGLGAELDLFRFDNSLFFLRFLLFFFCS